MAQAMGPCSQFGGAGLVDDASRIMLKGGRVVDPVNGTDALLDILVEDGVIAALARPGALPLSPGPCTVHDLSGKVVVPGLVDMHVHLREPGQEHKETIATGTRAAAHGGFTAVCCMPNTQPANDNPAITRLILDKARQAGFSRVYPAGAVTRGLAGHVLVDFEAMAKAGAVAFSDDGMPVADPGLMVRALEAARDLGAPVLSHCEEMSLVRGGVMNLGETARRLGRPGICNEAESAMVIRDIALCRKTKARLHICHVSTAQAVEAVRRAKEEGVAVTAETAPHYFTLTEEAVLAHGANAKMNPPLRSARDREAVLQGLADGVLDVIATDHAPHAPGEKQAGFGLAPNGVVGLETSLALSLALVRQGVLTLEELVRKMAVNPARILGLNPRGLIGGAPADITVMDMERKWRVDPAFFLSKSRNTPFEGMEMTGAAFLVLAGGAVIFS